LQRRKQATNMLPHLAQAQRTFPRISPLSHSISTSRAMAEQNPAPARPEQFVPGAVPTPDQLASLPHDNQRIKMNAVPWTLATLATLFLALRLAAKLWRRK